MYNYINQLGRVRVSSSIGPVIPYLNRNISETLEVYRNERMKNKNFPLWNDFNSYSRSLPVRGSLKWIFTASQVELLCPF